MNILVAQHDNNNNNNLRVDKSYITSWKVITTTTTTLPLHFQLYLYLLPAHSRKIHLNRVHT